MAKVRTDHWLITNIVEKNSRVLDVGCGDGELMKFLNHVFL
jgi:cyclopropane fatty-acyl-phospholipid synthase-like methyltransferase